MGMSELLVVVLIAIIVLGPKKLPEVAQMFGKFLKVITEIKNSFQNEIDKVSGDSTFKDNKVDD